MSGSKRPGAKGSILPTTVVRESYRATSAALCFEDVSKTSSPYSQMTKNSPKRSLSLFRAVKGLSSVLFTAWLGMTIITVTFFCCSDSSAPRSTFDLIKSSSSSSSFQKRNNEVIHSKEQTNRKLKFQLPEVAPLLFSSNHKHIPLPLPPNKISVVIMNHSRPRMIRESSLMLTLLSHPSVHQVLLLHSNPNTAFEYVHPKVLNIDATHHNDQMGLSLRFYFCQLADNDWVIHVDDDMEFTSSTLSELILEFAKDTRRIVGRFGRDFSSSSSSSSTAQDKYNSVMFNGYNSKDSHKNTEVVLTKFMIMERNICPSFFELSHLIWEDTVLNHGEGPLWNGEDIFMSLVANHVYGKASSSSSSSSSTTTTTHHQHQHQQQQRTTTNTHNNYAMDWLDVWNAPDYLKDYDSGKLDISGGMAGLRIWDWKWWQSLWRRNRHYSYRGKLWSRAKERLDQLLVLEDDL